MIINKTRLKERIKPIHIIIILIIIGLGLFILNQAISLHYKGVLIADPCRLCEDYNQIKNPWGEVDLNFSELINNSPK